MNKIEIEIPVGKEVDWKASAKQKQIVFKDKQLTYENVCNQLFTSGFWYSDNFGNILYTNRPSNDIQDANNASTKHQLECIIAKNKLVNTARCLNGEWNPYEASKTKEGHFDAHVLWLAPNKSYIGCTKITLCSENSNILFKSEELAEQAIEILGEETIKLALEPLY